MGGIWPLFEEFGHFSSLDISMWDLGVGIIIIATLKDKAAVDYYQCIGYLIRSQHRIYLQTTDELVLHISRHVSY